MERALRVGAFADPGEQVVGFMGERGNTGEEIRRHGGWDASRIDPTQEAKTARRIPENHDGFAKCLEPDHISVLLIGVKFYRKLPVGRSELVLGKQGSLWKT